MYLFLLSPVHIHFYTWLSLLPNKVIFFRLMEPLLHQQTPMLGAEDYYSGWTLQNWLDLLFKEMALLMEEAQCGGKTLSIMIL